MIEVEKMNVIIAALTLILGVIGAVFVYRQLNVSNKQAKLSFSTAKVNFLFEIYNKFENFNELHENIMEGTPIDTKEDWAKISSVLAIFEYVFLLHEEGIISIEEVDYFYGYRLAALYAHPKINNEYFINKRQGSWQKLNELHEKIKNQPSFIKHEKIAVNNNPKRS